ncbi:MAG TPA: 4'-phosphopantetheinyl transferase superfamily protein [Pyrinomonadaceae bacterium]|jgi:4'-phosphopantetheinyl transferase
MTSLNPVWTAAPRSPRLEKNEIHVWLIQLGQPAQKLMSQHSILSAEERERASNFHFDHHRQRYIVAHLALRLILSQYQGESPDRLRFRSNAYGKPALDLEEVEGGCETLHFNLSHSEDLALLAVSRGRALGVDIESIRPDFAHQQIAERFFSEREAATLDALPRSLQPEAFFNCWTRKEAYIKARGEGLSLALDGFDVSLVPGERAALLSVRDDPEEALRWSLRELPIGPGYAGALAVEGHDWRLKCWRWAQHAAS